MQRLVYSTSTNYSVTIIVLSVATSSTFSHSLKRAIKFFVVCLNSLFWPFFGLFGLNNAQNTNAVYYCITEERTS